MSDTLTVMVIVLAYLSLTLGVGIWAHKRSKATVEDYFLAGRGVGTVVLFFTLVATNFSAFFFLGFAGASYRLGWGFYGFMAFGTSLVGLSFFIVGRKVWLLGKLHGYVTPGELVSGQTGSKQLGYIFTAIMVIFTLPYMATQPYAAGLVLDSLTEGGLRIGGLPDHFAGALLLTSFMVAYVFLGGMRSSTMTDLVQGIMMCILLTVAVFVVVSALGGFEEAGEDMWDNDNFKFQQTRDEGSKEVWFSDLTVGFVKEGNTNASIVISGTIVTSSEEYIEGTFKTWEYRDEEKQWPGKSTGILNVSKERPSPFSITSTAPLESLNMSVVLALANDTEEFHNTTFELQKGKSLEHFWKRADSPVTERQWFSYTILWVMCVPMFPQLFTRFYIPRSQKQLMRAAVAYPLLVPFLFLAPVLLGVFGHLTFDGLDKLGSDNIVPKMMVEHAPLWLAALVMAGGLAAFMSTADSQLLALSSMVTRDGIKNLRPDLSDLQQFLAGRGVVLVLALFGLALAYDPPDTIFDIVSQAFTGLAVLFPTAIAVLYWQERLRPNAAIASLLVGEAIVAWNYWLHRSGETLPDWFLRGFHPALPIVLVATLVLVGTNYLLEYQDKKVRQP